MVRIPKYRQPAEAPDLRFPQVADGSALAAPGRALDALGGAITGMASNLQQEQEQQQRKARGEATWYGNQTLIQQGAQDDADWDAIKKANPDPNTWIGEWQKVRQPRQQQFLGGFANDPELSQEFNTKVQTADAADMVRRKREVEAANGQYAAGILETAAATAREQSIRNPDQADNYRIQIDGTIDGFVAAGRITEEQGKVWKQNYRDNRAFDKFQMMADTPDGRQALPGAMGVSAPGAGDPSLPAGMRNNNPGNIKYTSPRAFPGVVGPSVNTDQGDPQAVFTSPDAGMAAMVSLVRKKYNGGKDTVYKLIAAPMGWTPGYEPAAANIAKAMGVGVNDQINLNDPATLHSFIRALLAQEHGPAAKKYSDEFISNVIGGNYTVPQGSVAAQQPPKMDPTFAEASPQMRLKMLEQMPGIIAQNERQYAAQMGVAIQQSVADQTVVLQGGGEWNGPSYGVQDYVAAYGADEGPARYYADQRALGTATAIGNMQGMSENQIADAVAQKLAAIPDGPGAALATQTYEDYQSAAKKIIERRNADPAAEAMRNGPIARMYELAAKNISYLPQAVQANLTYQQSLGIPADKRRPLQNEQAARMVAEYTKPTDNPREAVRQVIGTVMAFKDPAIQQQVFSQLEEKGLPPGVKFAVRAASEGRMSSAEVLGIVAMLASDKPLSTGNMKPAEFTQMVEFAMQSGGSDTSQTNYTFDATYFGMDTGSPQAIKVREEAAALVDKTARWYLTTGQAQDPKEAVKRAAKDLYGNVQAYNVTGPGMFSLNRDPANVNIMLPAGENGAAYQPGFDRLRDSAVKPAIAARLERNMRTVAEKLPPEQAAAFGNMLRLEADNILTMGSFRNIDANSFGYLDPHSGGWVTGPDGKLLVFSKDDVMGAAQSIQPSVKTTPSEVMKRATDQWRQDTAPLLGTFDLMDEAVKTGRQRQQEIPPLVQPQPTPQSGVFDMMDEAVSKARGPRSGPTGKARTGGGF